MREICEFRVDEGLCSRLFSKMEGKRRGDSVREIHIDRTDPRFPRIGELQQELRRSLGRPFFYGWDIRRIYTPDELESARCFQLIPVTKFEPAGEHCGTEYDEIVACPKCGAGARRVSELCLPTGRIPKQKDISVTIANELVISKRAVDIFEIEAVSGIDFRPISACKSKVPSNDWFELIIRSSEVHMVPPTQAGNGLFDEDAAGLYRCPNGDTIGLNMLTEVSIDLTTWRGDDIECTRQFVGYRRGYLRPERVIVVSPKIREIVKEHKLRGFNFEVVHLKQPTV